MTWRDGMGREVVGGFRMENMCMPGSRFMLMCGRTNTIL